VSSGPEEIAQAIARLKAGGVVAFPTETVYGLGADAFNEDAVAKVFALKGRPATNPLIVHVSGSSMARRVAADWPARADRLARSFWPGPLSLVVPKAPDLPSIVTAGLPAVALRSPLHPLTLALIDAADTPIVGPSANRSGHVSPTTAEHVRREFDGGDVLVLDGGPCQGGIESTVVSLLSPTPRVLRLGLVTPEQIAHCLGRIVDIGPAPADEAPVPSPGQLPTHYAPHAPARLVAREAVPALLAERSADAIVVVDTRSHPGVRTVVLPAEAREYAAGLYAALRRADDMNPGLIAIVAPERKNRDGALWDAIVDRLARATAPRP